MDHHRLEGLQTTPILCHCRLSLGFHRNHSSHSLQLARPNGLPILPWRCRSHVRSWRPPLPQLLLPSQQNRSAPRHFHCWSRDGKRLRWRPSLRHLPRPQQPPPVETALHSRRMSHPCFCCNHLVLAPRQPPLHPLPLRAPKTGRRRLRGP